MCVCLHMPALQFTAIYFHELGHGNADTGRLVPGISGRSETRRTVLCHMIQPNPETYVPRCGGCSQPHNTEREVMKEWKRENGVP